MMGDTGFLKKMTAATITTTRFTQLPTECVTGDTRCRIMYENCWYAWKQNPAMTARWITRLGSKM